MEHKRTVRVIHVSIRPKNTDRCSNRSGVHAENNSKQHTYRFDSHSQSKVYPISFSGEQSNGHPESTRDLSNSSAPSEQTKSVPLETLPRPHSNRTIDLSYITETANSTHRTDRRKRKEPTGMQTINCRRICCISLAVCVGLWLLGILIPVCILLLAKSNTTQQPTTTVISTTALATITPSIITTTTSTSTTTTTLHNGWNATAVTVAGSASSTGPGANQLSYPIGLAIDSSKAIFIADRDNNRVQKWLVGASSGITVAGSSSGISGSTVNYLSTPRDVELDSSDNVYIPDASNHRVVFWIAGASSCTVVAGNGTAGSTNYQLNSPYGVAHDWSTGILYIADTYNNRIMSYASGASTGNMVIGGLGTGITQLSFPTGLYFDSLSSSLLIANSGANNVVRWTVGASSWTLVAGSVSGSSGTTSTLLNYPRDVTLDSMSNVYVADATNQRIQFFIAGQSNGTTIAGVTGVNGNNATLLSSPISLVVDSQFNVYVADFDNNRVQRFDHY